MKHAMLTAIVLAVALSTAGGPPESTKDGATVYVVDVDGSSLKAIDKGAERYGEGARFGEILTTEDGTDCEQGDGARGVPEGYIRGSPVQLLPPSRETLTIVGARPPVKA